MKMEWTVCACGTARAERGTYVFERSLHEGVVVVVVESK
jgi:hypothetical protein